jgi:hypothetical protein
VFFVAKPLRSAPKDPDLVVETFDEPERHRVVEDRVPGTRRASSAGFGAACLYNGTPVS